MKFVDTHCHIHDPEFYNESTHSTTEMLQNALKAGVEKLICVGTSVTSSRQSVEFTYKHDNCYSSLAIHPHEAEHFSDSELEAQIQELENLANKHPDKLVAIGECGLDYYYHSDPKVYAKQQKLLILHLELAKKLNLPVIFHIRDPKESNGDEIGQAFVDFFDLIDNYKGIKGVVHSFTASNVELKGIVSRGFFVGLNGIMTFTKDEKQLDAARKVPLENLVIETDAPFLTPAPFRGTINEPKHVILITKFLSELRDEPLALLAKQTTKNAKILFNL